MAHQLSAVLPLMQLSSCTACKQLHAVGRIPGNLLTAVIMPLRKWQTERAIDHHCHALGMLQQLYQRPTAMMSSSLAGETPSPEALLYYCPHPSFLSSMQQCMLSEVAGDCKDKGMLIAPGCGPCASMASSTNMLVLYLTG